MGEQGAPPSVGRWAARPSVGNQTLMEPAGVWEPSGAVWARGPVGGVRAGKPSSAVAVGVAGAAAGGS